VEIDIRIGALPTADELRPRTYRDSDGALARSTLTVAPTRAAEIEGILATWTYDGAPVLGAERRLRPGTEILTKEHTELFGVIRTYGCAQQHDLQIEAGAPGDADVRARQRGREFFIECTNVRPGAEFFAHLRAVRQTLSEIAERDEALLKLRVGANFSVGFIKPPGRLEREDVAREIVRAIARHDWTRGDLYDLPAQVSHYVGSVTRFAGDGSEPIACAMLMNAQAPPQYVESVLEAIEVKKAKAYAHGPLHLAITVVEAFDALIPKIAKVDVDLGQFERVLISDAQDVVIFERVSDEAV
jgi:hypothetical protein